jgi:hypothetical protein
MRGEDKRIRGPRVDNPSILEFTGVLDRGGIRRLMQTPAGIEEPA